MIRVIYILLLSVGFAGIIEVPQDRSTIQDAIDSANPGDEILVDDGTYVENILIEKDIILRSVNGADVTTIDGGNPDADEYGSSILIRPESGSSHKPIVQIDGFKIINGRGTNIINKTYDEEVIEKVGGGLFVYVNSPKVNNCKFISNGKNNTNKGGGVFAVSDKEDSDFSTRDDYVDAEDLEPASGELDLSNNVFSDNYSQKGKTLYVLGEEDYSLITMENDSLDVFSSVYESASYYWVQSQYDIDYENATGEVEAILTDVWVDPINGQDEGNIIGDESNPFLTINYAMGMIYVTEDDGSITIHLTEGTFSPSGNGELFPIIMISNMNLIGQGEEVTILDAELTARVITMEWCQNNYIANFSITGGYTEGDGGGIKITVCSLLQLNNLNINWNQALSDGGGIAVISSAVPSPFSTPLKFNNVMLTSNFAFRGGGINLYNSSLNANKLTVIYNLSESSGSGIFSYESNLIIINSIIWNNAPQGSQIPYSALAFYSNIGQGDTVFPGEGNINTDPLFLLLNEEDFLSGNIIINDDSPCIDAGISNFEIDGEIIVNIPPSYHPPNDYGYSCGQAPDMGAYEYCEEECEAEQGQMILIGDLTGDGEINILDVVQIINMVLELSAPNHPCAADYNEDGEINILDIILVAIYILEN